MMFLCPAKLSVKSFLVFLMVACFGFISLEINAQTKKSSSKSTAKNQSSSKTSAKKSDDKKSDKKSAKNDKKTDKKSDKKSEKTTASKKDKTKANDKNREKEKSKDKNSAGNDKNSKNSKLSKAEQAAKKREEAERLAAARRAEEIRRQAALAEQRRREAAARAARERQLAFERGLKTETQENITSDNTEGEDLEVRRAAINALGNHAGTVVVMEPQTGKVLSIVNQEWGIRRGFKPCSTIKLVTGVAGVNENAIDSASGNIRNRRFPLDLDDALAHSNNSYFQAVGSNLGNERMISYAKALGLGEKTGINVDNESAGKLPYGNNSAKIYSHGDDFEVTPLQLGVMVSAISNGGKVVVPQVPRSKVEKTSFRGFMRREIEIPKENLQRVLPGMIGAVNYGTARRASDYSLNIAGKTGSCIGQGSWLGLFASVAPVVNPRLAVVVVTRGSGERGKYASEIAGQIYKSLAHRFNDGKDFVAKIPLELKPQQKTNAKTSAQLDSEEGEDSDEGDAVKPAPKPIPSPKKVESKSSKSIFEPVIITKKSDSQNTKDGFEPTVIVSGREQTRPRVVKSKP